MERKLASIQKVISLSPIENADNIEVCNVLGWHCVVKKGEVKPDDLVVYFEVDSILPKQPEFEFLAARNYRIKTIRLRKQISQGLVFPISEIKFVDLSSFKEDDDVTEILQVQKYELPEERLPGANLRGKVKGNFPSFLKKTDETRIQSIPKILEKYRGQKFFYTEKLDGSSATFYLRDNEFGVCSRNLDLKKDSESPEEIHNAFWKAAIAHDIEGHMRLLNRDNISIQGELIGPGIQKNKYNLKEFDLRFYNVWDIEAHAYIPTFQDFIDVIAKMELKTVPIMGDITLNHTVDELVEMSKGKSVLYDVYREGFVFRPEKEQHDDKLGRLSFKVINPLFLLKFDE